PRLGRAVRRISFSLARSLPATDRDTEARDRASARGYKAVCRQLSRIGGKGGKCRVAARRGVTTPVARPFFCRAHPPSAQRRPNALFDRRAGSAGQRILLFPGSQPSVMLVTQ